MQVQVLSSTTTTQQGAKGPYQMVEVAYKNLTFQGKVESKKLMPFGNGKAAFEAMSLAKPTEVFEVEVVKNEKTGYNEWVKVTKGVAGSTNSVPKPTTTSTAGTAPTKGGWETPEERAKKQIYIVRQSSLSTAVAALSVGSKVHPTVEDVIEYAKKFEAYVFGDSNAASVIAQDLGGIETLPEDLPWDVN